MGNIPITLFHVNTDDHRHSQGWRLLYQDPWAGAGRGGGGAALPMPWPWIGKCSLTAELLLGRAVVPPVSRQLLSKARVIRPCHYAIGTLTWRTASSSSSWLTALSRPSPLWCQACLHSLTSLDPVLQQKWAVNRHTMGYYSALQRNGILTHTTIGKNLRNIMLREISQPQKDKYKIPLILRSLKYQIYRDRSSTVVARGWEMEKWGSVV